MVRLDQALHWDLRTVHIDKPLVAKGDQVKAGQKLAVIAPAAPFIQVDHLHFTITEEPTGISLTIRHISRRRSFFPIAESPGAVLPFERPVRVCTSSFQLADGSYEVVPVLGVLAAVGVVVAAVLIFRPAPAAEELADPQQVEAEVGDGHAHSEDAGKPDRFHARRLRPAVRRGHGPGNRPFQRRRLRGGAERFAGGPVRMTPRWAS